MSGQTAAAVAQGMPADARLLTGGGRGDLAYGNIVVHCAVPAGDAVIKIYQGRRGRWREMFANLSQRVIEKKRGVSPHTRRATEILALLAWREQGFEVPHILPGELPSWVAGRPALMLEFVPGPTLREVLRDPQRAASEKLELAATLAADHGRRHRRALESGDTLLVQEHAAAEHVLVSPGRLVTFDFEHAYQPGFPMPVALAYEIASTYRALSSRDDLGESIAHAYVEAYPEPAILRESCSLFRSRALGWRLYRAREMRQRGERSKTDAMMRLSRQLGD